MEKQPVKIVKVRGGFKLYNIEDEELWPKLFKTRKAAEAAQRDTQVFEEVRERMEKFIAGLVAEGYPEARVREILQLWA